MTLANPTAFYDALRAGLLGPTLSPTEVTGVGAILEACAGWPASHVAYALATAFHETAGTMQPVKERGGEAYFFRMYDPHGARPKVAAALGNTQAGDGVRFAGRGDVQITGRANYAKFAKILGVPLVEDPDLALLPKHAAAILRIGMSQGAFTGRRLADYLKGPGAGMFDQFVQCRRIINALDRADDIAHHALDFQKALRAGAWQAAPA